MSEFVCTCETVTPWHADSCPLSPNYIPLAEVRSVLAPPSAQTEGETP